MAKITKPLTDTEIRKAKPKDKQYKLYDGGGLYLLVTVAGRKRWVMDYSFLKKRNSLGFGNYPDVSLREARTLREEIKEKIRNNINPSNKNKSKSMKTFEFVAKEYFAGKEDLSKGYIEECMQKLRKNIFPYHQNQDIDEIETLEMLKTLQIIDKRGSNSSAKKTFGIVGRVYTYAVMQGYAKRNIMADLDKKLAFRTVSVQNFKHTTKEKELAEMLRIIENYHGDYVTRNALSFMPYVFMRPLPIRFMEWSEIDFDKKIWTIPAEKMKGRTGQKKEHIVPLTDSSIQYIKNMRDISYPVSTYVFPSPITNLKPLSENTLTRGLKRMGFDVTAHGFRHTASTLLHENISEHGFMSDIIEMQLAHTVGNSVHQVYNKAQYLPERIKLMQWWSDYLDNLKKV